MIKDREKPQVKCSLEPEVSKSFDDKLKESAISKKEVLETAVHAYINGSAKKLTKSGKVIKMTCEVYDVEY